MANYSVNDFNIKKLGSFYYKDKTIFTVFSPDSNEMDLVVFNKHYRMHKRGCCFEIALGGNLQFARYYYENENKVRFLDPFAYLAEDNYSIVLDTSRFNSETVLPQENDTTIIYELNVRDFSCDDNYPGLYGRKFLALSEPGLSIGNYAVGLDYLRQLGVSHIQLMPIFAYDNDKSDYNWGYNPIAYNYVNKDYIFDENNPYAYINEFRKTVNRLHSNNLRVTLDVVFNHVYDAKTFDLEKMIPGHALRRMPDGSLAKGSLCGNELKSEDPFVREYIIEMVKRYVRLFDIDGIRIDQMGIMDYETVNLLLNEVRELKKDFIVYGEGWNMGDVLDENLRASIRNAHMLPEIGMFNDFFRDTIAKYICGDDRIYEDVKIAFSANGNNLARNQSINYIECHDNNTFFDRLLRYKNNDSLDINVSRCKLGLAIVMLARGIPFIHSGQEFLRTKLMVENSYNASEEINKLDWNRRIVFDNVVEYFKSLVLLRKQIIGILNDDKAYVTSRNYYDTIVCQIEDLIIFINASANSYDYSDEYKYNVLLDYNGNKENDVSALKIMPYSLLVAKRV